MKSACGIELFNEVREQGLLFTGGGWIEAGVEAIRFRKFNLGEISRRRDGGVPSLNYSERARYQD
jgi:hypothetical protein